MGSATATINTTKAPKAPVKKSAARGLTGGGGGGKPKAMKHHHSATTHGGGGKGLKVVHISNPMKVFASAAEFRSLVQELTGRDAVDGTDHPCWRGTTSFSGFALDQQVVLPPPGPGGTPEEADVEEEGIVSRHGLDDFVGVGQQPASNISSCQFGSDLAGFDNDGFHQMLLNVEEFISSYTMPSY